MKLLLSLATFLFCSHGENFPHQCQLPGVQERVTHLSRFPRATKTQVGPYTEAKFTPGYQFALVSCPKADISPRPLCATIVFVSTSCEQLLCLVKTKQSYQLIYYSMASFSFISSVSMIPSPILKSPLLKT